MNSLLLPTYFPSISHFAVMAQSENITFEMEDNFQKQTNRNRTYIYSPNGIQLLNIPVKHSKTAHQKTKDVLIENPLLNSNVIQVVLSLIENLVSKRMHVTHKNILVLALPLISIYSTDSNFTQSTL